MPDNVGEKAVGAFDPAGAVQETGRGDRARPEGRGGRPQASKRPEEKTGLESSQNEGNQFLEHCQGFVDVPTLVPNGYIAGKRGVEVHIGIRSGASNWYSQYFVARLWRLNHGQDRLPRRYAIVPTRGPMDVLRDGCANVRKLNRPMLIGVREVGQGFQHAGLPSWHLERLEIFELVGVGGVHMLPVDMFGPLGIDANDWELNLFDGPAIGRFNAVEVLYGELPCEVIEGGSQVVDDFSDAEVPLIVEIYQAIDAINDGPLIWLEISPKGEQYRMRPELLFDGPAKHIDLRVRSFELGS